MALKPMPAANLRSLQAFLRRQGYSLGTGGPLNDGVDGDWGPITEAALNALITGEEPAKAAPEPKAPGPRPLSAAYEWLNQMPVGAMPRTIWCALRELGVKEMAGGANSPTIMGWAAEVGLQATYTADKIPWCGLFAAVIVKRAGKPVVDGPLWALNWGKFGVKVDQPGLGDVLTFLRDGGGHVGFYVAEDRGTAKNDYEDAAYHVLGGNQSDEVNITRVLKKRLKAARRPVYKVQPAAVKPYIVAANGALSTNEV
jgi:uncharacterized protein (TIGR02594 family)